MTPAPVVSPLRAYAGAVLAIGCLSAMDGAMKLVGLEVGTLSALAWRAAIAAPLLTVAWLMTRKQKPTPEALRYHWIRGLVMVPMSLGFFWGLGRVPMAQAIALTFIAPLLALVLAGVVLKEKVGPRVVVGSLIAFGGVLLIFVGQVGADFGPRALWGSAAILGSAALYAVNIVLMRRQSQNSSPLEVAVFYFLIAGGGFWVIALATGVPAFPGRVVGPLLIATGLSILGMLGLAWAYGRGEASYLSSSEYSGFVWASLFGFLIFSEVPRMWTILGAGAIMLGCWVAARPASAEEILAA